MKCTSTAGSLSMPNRSNAARKMSQRRGKSRASSSLSINYNRKNRKSCDQTNKRTRDIRNYKQQLRRGDLFSIDFTCPPMNGKSSSDRVAGPFPAMYTNDPSTVNTWINHFVYNDDACYFIGFDTESVPDAPWMVQRGLIPGLATIQLSTTKSSIIFHLSHCDEIPSALTEVLYNNEIAKIGVGIDEDMLDLYRNFGKFLEGRCRFDLAGIGSTQRQMVGLKRLLLNIVGVSLDKPKRISRSNWSSLPLSEQQLHYSARDAWAAVALMEKLRSKRPDVFGSKGSLFKMLESERTMQEIDERARKRKEVKSAYKQIFFKVKNFESKNEADADILKKFEELDKAMKILRPDGLIIFDPIDLKPL